MYSPLRFVGFFKSQSMTKDQDLAKDLLMSQKAPKTEDESAKFSLHQKKKSSSASRETTCSIEFKKSSFVCLFQ